MTWLDAATRWRTWVDRDEPGRVAAYLDSLEEDGCDSISKVIDIHTATVQDIDKMYWGYEKDFFISGSILTWPAEYVAAMNKNIKDRLGRIYSVTRVIVCGFEVARGPWIRANESINLDLEMQFRVYEPSMVLRRGFSPGWSGHPQVDELHKDLRDLWSRTDQTAGHVYLTDSPAPDLDTCPPTSMAYSMAYLVGLFRVTIEMPPQSQLGSWARDRLQNHPQ